jgi:sugar diacid utilization regulator
MPATAEVSVPEAGTGTYTLFGVGGEPRITSWFLACAGREQDWPHELRESVAELAADVALERARLNAARTGDRKLAEAIVTMLASGSGEGAAPAEIASLMRAAGLPPDGRYLVAAVGAEADRVTGPNADRWHCDLAEELVSPAAEGALAAPLGNEIVVLVPAPGDGDDPDGSVPAAHRFAATIRAAQPVVESDRSRVRLTVGVSGPAESVTALPGALHEAESARRLAALRGTSAVSVVTSDEVTSHELLLATVPASVLRSFRERLLGPLLAYDDQHRAELLPTLREFLACSGSWNVCAGRMYVHVNTVRYRIRRIEELTGRDLSRLDDQVDFFLALRVR